MTYLFQVCQYLTRGNWTLGMSRDHSTTEGFSTKLNIEHFVKLETNGFLMIFDLESQNLR